eukprot:scaffold372546_cov18-Prasinocladus_malaysianus.AAC.1
MKISTGNPPGQFDTPKDNGQISFGLRHAELRQLIQPSMAAVCSLNVSVHVMAKLSLQNK